MQQQQQQQQQGEHYNIAATLLQAVYKDSWNFVHLFLLLLCLVPALSLSLLFSLFICSLRHTHTQTNYGKIPRTLQSTQTPHAAQLERDAAANVAAAAVAVAVNDLINSDKVKAALEFGVLRK